MNAGSALDLIDRLITERDEAQAIARQAARDAYNAIRQRDRALHVARKLVRWHETTNYHPTDMELIGAFQLAQKLLQEFEEGEGDSVR